MALVSDSQIDFLGGMRDNISPELMQPNEYAFGKNLELRNGRPETRRASFRILEDNGTTFTQGAGIFNDIVRAREFVMIAQDQKIFRVGQNYKRVEMKLPAELTENPIRFLQALDRLYIFRGEGLRPFSWSGDISEDIILVPDATGPGLSSMPGSNRVLFAYNRFWIIVDNDTLRISDDLSEEFNFTTNSFKVTQGDGQRLTKVHPFGAGKLMAFKDRSIGLIGNANNFTTAVPDLTLEFIDDEVGCDSQDSVVSIGKDIFFKSIRGFYSLIQTSEQNAQLLDIPLSEPISNLIARIEQLQAGKTQAVQFDNYYIPGIPIDGAADPNAIFAYDLEIKKWVGLWEIVDSVTTDDDGLWRYSRLLLKTDPKLKLISVGLRGGLAELLRGRHKDLVPTKGPLLNFRDSNTANVSFDSATIAAIQSQTAGQIEISFQRIKTPATNITLLFVDGTTGLLTIFVHNAPLGASGFTAGIRFEIRFVDSSGSTQWEFINKTTLDDDLEVGIVRSREYDMRLVHDGIEPTFFLDGIKETISFSNSTDKSKWFSSFTITAIDLPTSFPTTAGGLDSLVRRIAFLNATGWDDIAAHFPLNEGVGNTVTGYEVVAGKSVASFSGTFSASPTYSQWLNPSAASDIVTQFITRGYSFAQVQLFKKITRGLVKMTHMDPSITIKVLNSEPFNDEELLSALIFDEVKYDVHGVVDWDPSNVNNDFETPYRQRYAPIVVPDTGFTVDPGGVTMDVARERSQFVNPQAVAKWFQLDISSIRDMIGITAVVLDAQSKNLATTRAI